MKVLYQMVTATGADVLTREELEKRYYVRDRDQPVAHVRKELRDQPKVDGYCGPMWGGYHDEDGENVFLNEDGSRKPYGSQKPIESIWIRYETWDANEIYSR